MHNSENAEKKQYQSPELTSYGSIAQLTLAGMDGGNDGNDSCNSATGSSGDNPLCS